MARRLRRARKWAGACVTTLLATVEIASARWGGGGYLRPTLAATWRGSWRSRGWQREPARLVRT